MSTMQKASRLYQALHSGKTAFGAWNMLAGTNLVRTMASADIDWICVDTEHGNIADHEMHENVTAIAATSVSPIVRIAAAEPWMVKRALDTGAHGIMVPLLQTADEVRRLVSAAKFPPRGIRGFGSPFPMNAFAGVSSPVDYLQQSTDALLTLVQIETKEALSNVDEIASVDGCDVLFVGPFDLGNNIGHPILGEMDKELKEAIEKIKKAAQSKGKFCGIYATNAQEAKAYAAAGFNMINVSGDVIALASHVADNLKIARGS